MKFHIRTFVLNMPHVGIEPRTATYADQTITQLTKLEDNAAMKLRIHICAKPATSTYAARTITKLTKCEDKATAPVFLT